MSGFFIKRGYTGPTQTQVVLECEPRAIDLPRIGLPATGWMLALGAVFLRTETELVLKSRRVVPGLLLERGFEFAFPRWADAARDLCERWRAARAS